jgi:putative DNA primase/helicase
LLGKLAQDETLPWGEFSNGRPLTPIGLARLLKPFGICPGTIRLEKETAKGYLKENFADAWTRYLPLPLSAVTQSQPA